MLLYEGVAIIAALTLGFQGLVELIRENFLLLWAPMASIVVILVLTKTAELSGEPDDPEKPVRLWLSTPAFSWTLVVGSIGLFVFSVMFIWNANGQFESNSLAALSSAIVSVPIYFAPIVLLSLSMLVMYGRLRARQSDET